MKNYITGHLVKSNRTKSFSVFFLIASYFVLEANNQYWRLIPFSSSIKTFGLIFLSMSVSFLIIQRFIKWEKALLIICWFTVHYLFFGVFYKSIASVELLSFLKQYKYYFPFLFLVTGLFIYLIIKLKETFLLKFVLYTIVLFTVFVSVEILRSLIHCINNENKTQNLTEHVILNSALPSSQPDVFLIVLDEYAGNSSLMKYYGFNNQPFSDRLKSRGFFVTQHSQSNYNGTLFSTLSLLNMSYLDSSLIGDVKSPKAYAKVAKEISYNRLFEFFRSNDYKVINNSFLRINQTASKPYLILPIEDRLMTEKTFGYLLINHFMLYINSNKIQQLAGTFYAKGDAYNQDAILNLKKSVTDTASKLFVYTHLMMPHSPYLRDENGRVRNFAEAHNELMKKKYDEPYIHYLKYSNQVIEELLDTVLSKRQNAVIILVSDHGNRFKEKKHQQADDFSNFIAVYAPNKNYNGFTDSVSLVNVFRLIMKNQFAQNIELLPNRQINVVKGVLN